MNTTAYLDTFLLGMMGWVWDNSYGSPLQLGPGGCGSVVGEPRNCAWGYRLYRSNTGTSLDTAAIYQSDILSNLTSLSDLTSNNTVIRSLDIQVTNNVFATAELRSTSAGNFTASMRHVPVSDLQSLATDAGLQGQVVTALSLDSGKNAYVISYSWSGNGTATYEAAVSQVSVDTVGSEAQAMAAQGYVITAFGGNTEDGLFMIGTRLKGTRTARNVMVVTDMFNSEPFTKGYVIVAVLYNPTTRATTWVLEQ